MLLNPAPTHEEQPFEKMGKNCKMLRWIEDILLDIGWSLVDVIILDVCPLLSSVRLAELEKEGDGRKEQALYEAYDLTRKMLEALRHNIVISC
jgi:hypothetical protein